MDGLFRSIVGGIFNATQIFQPYKVQVVTPDTFNSSPVDTDGSVSLYRRNGSLEAVLKLPRSHSKLYSLFRLKDDGEAYAQFRCYARRLEELTSFATTPIDVNLLQEICDCLREKPSWSAAHVAAYVGFDEAFHDQCMRSKVNEPSDFTKLSPLMVAVQAKQDKCVTKLLHCGATLKSQDKDGNTVFHYAVESTVEIIEILSKYPYSREVINCKNNKRETAIGLSCLKNLSTFTEALLHAGADPCISNSTFFPIHAALKTGDLKSVELLCKNNAYQMDLHDSKYGGYPIHWARTEEAISLLNQYKCDINAVTSVTQHSALHVMIFKDRIDCAMALLCLGANTNLQDKELNTVLHLSVMIGNIDLVRALVIFGSNVNLRNKKHQTARHIASTSSSAQSGEILYVLHECGAVRCNPDMSGCMRGCVAEGTFNGAAKQKSRDSIDVDAFCEEMMNSKIIHETSYHPAQGKKVLCLDGGGIRGLVLIQLLIEIERRVQRPIRECFDWIGGTSTGGILALAITHGKSLQYCKGLYFRMKDEVFHGKRPYSSENLEKILKKEFGEHTTMDSITHPKVIVTAVLANRMPPKLHLFRNYIPLSFFPEDETDCVITRSYEQKVWHAARCSGAAPTFFRPSGAFLDGGLMSNNPTLDVLAEINQYNLGLEQNNMPSENLGLVVSLGTGRPPTVPIKSVDVFRPDSLLDVARCAAGVSTLGNLILSQVTNTDDRPVLQARSWCNMLKVPYFRFNPQLSEDIQLDCHDSKVIVNMLWETQSYIVANSARIQTLVDYLKK